MSSNRIIRAFLWKFLEKIGTKGIQLIIQIVLARILFPDDYGMVAILAVFISLSNVFIQGGFNTSLIQKKEASDIDFSTVLYASFVIAFFSYLVLFIFAPDIAAFYHLPQLKELLRVYSLSLFAGVINSVQYAYISRKLQFRIYTVTMVCASGISGIIGIVLAYQGFGVWTLVLQQLLANYLAVLFLSLFIKWRPLMVFSFQSLRETFGYGWKILATGLINTLYLNIYSLIVGKVYNTELLGLYNRGDQFPNLIVNNINDTVQSVIFPVLSEQQENKEAIRWIMKKGLGFFTKA